MPKKKVLLLSSMRSRNVGDLAMLRAAAEFVGNLPGSSVDSVVYGSRELPEFKDRIDAGGLISMAVAIKVKLLGSAMLQSVPSPVYRAILTVVTTAGRFALAAWTLFTLSILWLHSRVRFPVSRATASLHRSLIEADAVMTTGGGWANSLFILTFYEQLVVLLAARFIYRVPTFLIGDQLGPLSCWIDRRLTSLLLNRCEIVALRDPRSIETAWSLARTASNISLFCDWAYRWKGHRHHPPRPSLRIGVNLRSAHYANVGRRELDRVAAALLEIQTATPIELHLIPTCFDPHESDVVVLRDLQKRVSGQMTTTMHEVTSTEECLQIVGDMDMTVGVSYHFCLFSMMSEVPCLSYAASPYYEAKLGGLYDLFESTSWILSAERLRAGALASGAKALLQNRERERSRLSEINASLMQVRNVAGERLADRLLKSMEQTSAAG